MALKREPLIWVVVVAVFLIAPAIYLIEKPDHLAPGTILAIVEATATILGALFALFVAVAWHWPIFYRWFVTVPDVRGTWRGAVTPIDAAGISSAPIPATLLIKQSLFTISCIMYTPNMQSKSFSGSASLDEATDEERIVYSYSTDPVVAQRVTNPRGDGTAILVLNRNRHKILSGKYFTDRFTTGKMKFAFHQKKRDSSLPT